MNVRKLYKPLPIVAAFLFIAFIFGACSAANTDEGYPKPVNKLITYKLPHGYHLEMSYPYGGEDGNPTVEKSYSHKDGGYLTVGILSYNGKDCAGDVTQTVIIDEYVASLDRMKELEIDGETGYFGTRESDDMPDMVAVVYVSHGDYAFEFRMTNSDEQVTEEQMTELEKIVSSVRFKE